MAYNEKRGSVAPGCRTVLACQGRIDIVLETNPNLENTAVGQLELGEPRALVDAYEGLVTVRYSGQRFTSGGAFTALELAASYRFTTTALTGAVAS